MVIALALYFMSTPRCKFDPGLEFTCFDDATRNLVGVLAGVVLSYWGRPRARQI